MRYSRDFRARQPSGRRSIIQQALAILVNYGSAANLYLPGVGVVNGITAGNWTEQIGGASAAVDGAVGMVVGVSGTQYGPELVSNGTFDSGTSGWTTLSDGTITASGGVATITAVVLTATVVYTSFTTIPGQRYELRTSVQSLSAGTQGWLVGIAATGSTLGTFTSSATGQRIHYFTATTTTTFITWSCGSNGRNAVIDNVSVRAAGSVPLTQSTAANRPILRLSGGVYAWQCDGSNDHFTSTLAPGASGFLAAAVNRASTNVRHLFFGGGQIASAAGAGSRFLTDGAFQASIANGTTRQQFASTATLAPGTAGVASFWWGGSRLGAAINNAEADTALTVNPTSTTQIFLAGAVAVNYFDGTVGATIIMPTVLPTATERAILRRFIAILSGVTF